MKFCPVVPEICRGQVHVSQKEREEEENNNNNNKKRSKNISLQTLFGRLIKVSLLVKVGDENCSCLTNFIVKCN